ncbi:spore coat protein [Bacillus sp. Marseille-P3661]|uniref:spore coat protein n=1 Tax=Bacillus sp. Marseille-P3661 TaxID=1936234 RepID=UPI000C84B415|nr:spore coat protein [Bacillus sp. Marseille-P3661]
MNNDFQDPINAVGMPDQINSAIALNFLLNVKNGVRNYVIAITEAASPEVRAALRKQLDAAIDLHGELTDLMLKKGWLHAYDVKEQFKLDLQSADTAVKIANLTLFPNETNRLGTFATPYN